MQEFKKIHGCGTTTLIVSNEQINDIMKIVQTLEDSNLYWKESLKQLKMKQKKKGGFLSMLLGTFGASLLGNLLAGKGIASAGWGNKKGKEIVRAGTRKEWDFLCFFNL